MEFTEQPKQARIHVPNFEQFKGADESEKLDYKTEVDKWTPSFDDLPDWVEWVAQDSSGGWNGYDEDKPLWKWDDYGDDFEWLTVGDYMFIRETPLHPHGWRNTLTKRPEKRSERVSVEGKVNVSVEGIDEAIELNKILPAKVVFCDGYSQQATQEHYETKTGTDFIQRFSDVHSEERMRGALLFNIGKYCERYGGKDDTLKEAKKIADYANRLVEFEESLLEDEDV